MTQSKLPHSHDDNFIQMLIEAAPDAFIIVNAVGGIELVNQQTEELFGYTRAELLQMNLDSLLPERFRASHSKHRTKYVAAPRRRPMGMGLPFFGQHKNGEEFQVEISLSPLISPKGIQMIAIVRDVSERIEVEKALRAAERETLRYAQEAKARLALLQRIIDEMPNAVCVVRGRDARLVLANVATEQVWGTEWPLGMPMLEFLKSHNIQIFSMTGRILQPEELATLRALRLGEPVYHHQEVIRHANGTTLPVLMHALPLATNSLIGLVDDDKQEVEVALVVAQDVTIFKEAERLKDEFIGIAAHELRNPLSALKGFADMLQVQTARGHGPTLADWQQEAITSIDQSANRLIDLTNDLLDVTRLQAGRLELHMSNHDMVALLQRVIARQQVMTQNHQLSLRSPVTPIPIVVDSFRIEQVIQNLLNNAIKYSPDGGEITVDLEKDSNSDSITISIKDYGIGIPSSQHARIFHRFARADNTQSIGGTGLGLYLCREIINSHHGEIWFQSEESEGATFFVRLPLHETSLEESAAQNLY